MPGDFLRVMGKVLVIGGIGLAVGVAFGGMGLGSLLGAAAAASAGVGCLVGSMALQRQAIQACYGESRSQSTAESAGRSISPELADEDAAVSRFVEEMEAEQSGRCGNQFVERLERQGKQVLTGGKSLH